MEAKARVQIFVILLTLVVLGIFVYEGYQRWSIPEGVVLKSTVSEEIILKEKIISEGETIQQKEEPEKFSLPQVYLSSNRLELGDTLLIKVKSTPVIDEVSGKFGSQNLNFFKPITVKDWIAIVGINVREKPGEYNLVINFSDGHKIEKKLNIIERKFPITKLFLTKELKEKGYTPSKIIEDITTKENLLLREILSIFTPNAYFSKVFANPLEKIKVTGAYGNIRKNENLAIQHLGVDLKADINTPVYAINDGAVRFSKELNTYGKTLIIDHGLGIYSLYLHLNKFKVLRGEQVEQGDVIGFSGNTGYSIAPHLHFSVKVNGSSVDPLRFIETIENEMAKK